MPAQILVVERRGRRNAFLLDVDSGRVAATTVPPGTAKAGNMATVEGQVFALYADDGMLWFQWNDRRWRLADPALRLTYAHDLAARTTSFTADGQSITYPAWWIDDPAFDPLIPEQDRQEDYLAYVVFIWENADFQAELLANWSRAS